MKISHKIILSFLVVAVFANVAAIFSSGTLIVTATTTVLSIFFGFYFSFLTSRKREATEREVVSEIIQGVTSTANLDELLQLIHRSIGKILYAENCFVALHDPSTDQLNFEFWVDKFDPVPAPSTTGKSFSNYVLRTGKPLLLTNDRKREMFAAGLVERVGSESASWVGIPLITPERTVGVMVVQHYDIEGIYSQQDLAFLISVGDQIALAVERKRVEEALRISEEQYRLLFESQPFPMWRLRVSIIRRSSHSKYRPCVVGNTNTRAPA